MNLAAVCLNVNNIEILIYQLLGRKVKNYGTKVSRHIKFIGHLPIENHFIVA